MPSLKDLKNRIVSVKSTRKITSAMKMVAASKLRRAQERAESARPYAERMAQMLLPLAGGVEAAEGVSRLLTGTGKKDVFLLVVVTSDRGLCGAFNGSVVREARRKIEEFESRGKKVKLVCVGRKGRDLLRRDHADKILFAIEDLSKKPIAFESSEALAGKILGLYEGGAFDVAYVLFNRFKSAISQIVTFEQIVPVPVREGVSSDQAKVVELFEPRREEILSHLLPRNLAVQIHAALLESSASEQGARMTAMDNATRNAGDMIDKLTLNYNRSRQAFITKELIEIISGAEAV